MRFQLLLLLLLLLLPLLPFFHLFLAARLSRFLCFIHVLNEHGQVTDCGWGGCLSDYFNRLASPSFLRFSDIERQIYQTHKGN